MVVVAADPGHENGQGAPTMGSSSSGTGPCASDNGERVAVAADQLDRNFRMLGRARALLLKGRLTFTRRTPLTPKGLPKSPIARAHRISPALVLLPKARATYPLPHLGLQFRFH
jgi:hypothetical protein